MNPVLSIIIAVVIGIVGQILIKKGLNSIENLDFSGQLIRSYIKVFSSPLNIAGVLIYFSSALFWLYGLSKVNLSYAYPFLALSYVLILLTSWIFLGEDIPTLRWIGVMVICFGIFILYKS